MTIGPRSQMTDGVDAFPAAYHLLAGRIFGICDMQVRGVLAFLRFTPFAIVLYLDGGIRSPTSVETI